MQKSILFIILILGFLMSCQKSADIAIINAKVWTVDKSNPLAEAVAIKGDKIFAVGRKEKIDPLIGKNTKIIDAQGKLILPGFNDAHLHFIGGGLALMHVDLNGCKTPQEIQKRIAARIKELPNGSWITGRGWDHTLFNNGKWPDKSLLDKVSPHNPVFVRRVDGHIGWANSLALKLAKVDAATPNPNGGEILKDPKTGEPTGILKESATEPVNRIIPKETEAYRILAAEKALELAKRVGVTSVQDNSGVETVELYHRLLKRGKLTVRVSEWMDFNLAKNPEKLIETKKEFEKFCAPDKIRLGLLKGFTDGTLGSRTAWFFEPYLDDPSTSGIPQYSQEELTRMICTADSLGFQVGLHCIGAKANWMALNGYAEARRRFGARDSRHRLEHAQVLRLQDIPKLAELGVIASMQPTHCTSDLRWAEKRIGYERCKGAYAWKRILNSHAKIAFGTDWPVEPLDPMRGLYSAVTRQNIESCAPEGGWFPDQKFTMAEAIRLYTLDAAFGEFQEKYKGSISPGKLADIIILSKDLFSIPVEDILKTKVDVTIFDGKVVYRRKI
ncbi:MAG: amidohydrolase family protein [Actinobacteria bacterium]|nr:amidohydrolase family protein [Actinomycetota bacterium]